MAPFVSNLPDGRLCTANRVERRNVRTDTVCAHSPSPVHVTSVWEEVVNTGILFRECRFNSRWYVSTPIGGVLGCRSLIVQLQGQTYILRPSIRSPSVRDHELNDPGPLHHTAGARQGS